jgi:hypothetical protein
MAQRKRAKTQKKTPRRRAGAQATAATRATRDAGGPLTLAEARAIVRARAPARAAARKASAPAAAATLAAERQRRRQEHREEIARRTREYRAVMTLLKRHGARRATRAGGPARTAAFAPLQVLAEGDSWFDYPPFVLKGGIVPRLERRLGVPILNLAKAGDEVRYMLGVEERARLAQHLTDGCPAGGPWDVLLFSGGGNDIVGNPLALWLRDYADGVPPPQLIDGPRFAAALTLVRAGYEDLIALRDRLSPDTHLVFHGYDYAIPDGRGVCLNALGPWLKPAFDLRGFPSRNAAFATVRAMLERFAETLRALAGPRVTVIDAQGLLPAGDTAWWHNELHPSQPGYDAHTEKFRETLKALFPQRVA